VGFREKGFGQEQLRGEEYVIASCGTAYFIFCFSRESVSGVRFR